MSMLFLATGNASAKVIWEKTELKQGHTGKVTVLNDTSLLEESNNGKLVADKILKKGEEYRVYRYHSKENGLYGLGGNAFVKKNDSIKYETPSKSKLALLENKTNEPDEILSFYEQFEKEILNLSQNIDQGISQKEYSRKVNELFIKFEINKDKLSVIENVILHGKLIELTKKPDLNLDHVIFEFGNGDKFFLRNDYKLTSLYPTHGFESEIYPSLDYLEYILGITNNQYEAIYQNVSGGMDGILFPMANYFRSEKEFTETEIGADYFYIHSLLNNKDNKELNISTKNTRFAKEEMLYMVESPVSLNEFISYFNLNVNYIVENNVLILRFPSISAPRIRN